MTSSESEAMDAIEFPVDDATYDLLQALTSKLEAIDAYRTYMEDESGAERQLFERLAHEDIEHARLLLAALRQRLAAP